MGFADTLDQILTEGFKGFQMGMTANKELEERELRKMKLENERRLNKPRSFDKLIDQQFPYSDQGGGAAKKFIKQLADSSGALNDDGTITGTSFKELMQNIHTNPQLMQQMNTAYRGDLGNADSAQVDRLNTRYDTIAAMKDGADKKAAIEAFESDRNKFYNGLRQEADLAQLPAEEGLAKLSQARLHQKYGEAEIKSKLDLQKAQTYHQIKSADAAMARASRIGSGGANRFREWLAKRDYLTREKLMSGGSGKLAYADTGAYLSGLGHNVEDPRVKALGNMIAPTQDMLFQTMLRANIPVSAARTYSALAAQNAHRDAFVRTYKKSGRTEHNLVDAPLNTTGGNQFRISTNDLAYRIQQSAGNPQAMGQLFKTHKYLQTNNGAMPRLGSADLGVQVPEDQQPQQQVREQEDYPY